MKISSDWVVYYIRSCGVCRNVPNNTLGLQIKEVLSGMGCPQNPEGVQVRSPLYNAMHEELAKAGFARAGLTYDIELNRLPEFFRKLSDRLGVRFE
jgi:hypothetical protein